MIFWHIFFSAIWTAWAIYWFVSAVGNKAIARSGSLRQRLTYSLPLWLGILLFLGVNGRHALHARFLPPSAFFVLLGALLVLSGLAFTVWARVHLGGNWSGRVTLKQNHELIRTGPYAWVRHPIYTGLIVAVVGNAFALGQWQALLAAILIALSSVIKLRFEERWMIETFGEAYSRYKAQVPALFPGIY